MTSNITVNTQNSIRIAAEKILRFDPLALPSAVHDADIIFLTHDHYDHFSPEDIAKAANDSTLFVAPASMAVAMKNAGIPQERVTYLTPNESCELCGIKIEAVPAYNLTKSFHPKAKGWLGYVVEIGGSRVYVCGDTDDTPEARSVSCDIICVPIGGTFTCDAKSAADLVNAISPKAAIPTHYGKYVGSPADADVFESAVSKGIEVVRKIEF